MRHMAKRALSLLLALLLCLTLFPAAALAEEGTIRPVEDEEDGGLSGTPAPTEEDEPGTIVGDGVLDDPDDAAAQPGETAADEIQSIVASGTCGENLTWTLDDAGVLTISGTGAMTNWSYNGSPWYGQRESIKEVMIEDGVTSIGTFAFYGCSSLTSVTIPESVTSIGGLAFMGCSSLTSVTIPAVVTGIGDGVFAYCGSLQEILVPEGSKNYVSVDGVLYDASLQTLLQCPGGKTGEMTIPETVISIGDWAFLGCSSLTSLTIAASVTSIGKQALVGCTSLTEILVAEENKNYTSRDGVLYDADIISLVQCPGGKTGAMVIPSSVTGIRDFAFQECSLTSVTIPASVIGIGIVAFSGCSSLKSILFLGSAPTFGVSVFEHDNTTALYPIDNATWTADKLQNYNAEKLTWVGYRDEAKAYTIHFDANGGSDAPEDQIKGHNVDITLTDAVPSRENAVFLGWSTRRGAAAAEYLPGDRFGRNADTTLYAVWKLEAPILPTEAVLTLGSAKACAGQEFTVELSMEKNPGIMYLSFRLDYDADALVFLGAEDGLFTGWMVNTKKNFLVWDQNEDRSDNGVLLRLRFRAKEVAPTGETAIALAEPFATNYAEELLGIGSAPGVVTILPHTPGDVNGDGEVDGRDLVRLRKYLVGIEDAMIVEANANVDGDQDIDIFDLVRLRKYLARENVILE